MGHTEYSGRDKLRFLSASGLGLYFGWCAYQFVFGALTSSAGLGTVFVAIGFLLLLGVPSLIFQIPLSFFLHKRQQKAYERLPANEQRHDDFVTHRSRKILSWSLLIGFTAGLIVSQIQKPLEGVL